MRDKELSKQFIPLHRWVSTLIQTYNGAVMTSRANWVVHWLKSTTAHGEFP